MNEQARLGLSVGIPSAVTQTNAHAEGMEIVRLPAAIDAEAAVIDAISRA